MKTKITLIDDVGNSKTYASNIALKEVILNALVSAEYQDNWTNADTVDLIMRNLTNVSHSENVVEEVDEINFIDKEILNAIKSGESNDNLHPFTYEGNSSKLKRYLVFNCPELKCSGGMQDLYGSYNTVEEAECALGEINKEYTWSHIFDSDENKFVGYGEFVYGYNIK